MIISSAPALAKASKKISGLATLASLSAAMQKDVESRIGLPLRSGRNMPRRS